MQRVCGNSHARLYMCKCIFLKDDLMDSVNFGGIILIK